MPNENDELIGSFVEEANEFLSNVENDFLAIEEAGANVDHDLVNKVFRGIHSMKGSAGFLGLKTIGTLAHESENVLNLIRNDELIPTPAVVNSLLKSADLLRSMVNDVGTSNTIDILEYINELKAAVAGDISAETAECLNRDIDIAMPNGSLAFVMIKEIEPVSRQKQGCHIYVVEADFFADVQEKDRTPLDFLRSVYEVGELIDSYMSTAGVGDLSCELPDTLSFVMLLGSKLDSSDELADHLQVSPDRVHHIATPEQTSWEASGPQALHGPGATHSVGTKSAADPIANEPVVEAESAVSVAPMDEAQPSAAAAAAAVPSEAKGKPAKAGSAANANTTSSEQTSLRVNVKVLDTLMNLAGELVLGRNQLLQEASSKDHRGIEVVAGRIDQVTSELQEAIMQTRMQPIGTVFSKFPRIVRDLSGDLGKQCELVIDGKDVELDKTIIEGIGDPLTHLIRNSVDHGVETPDIRISRGKNPCGTVSLKAYHQAGKVNISISDDGAGIDVVKLKAKAVEKGIITAEHAGEISQRDALRLIFHPGFSMAAKVTSVSGRGVGMDVVKTNIERMGGTVDVSTELGVGTTIKLKLPLTLAIIPSLIVRGGEDNFAIPQVNINELVRIKASEVSQKIERVKSAEVLRLRGNLLPLIRLDSVLGKQAKYLDRATEEYKDDNRDRAADRRVSRVDDGVANDVADDRREGKDRRERTSAGALKIIVVESGHLRYGLIVDELYDSKEIVVKPLGHHMKGCSCLAGATILGDGNIALILDVAGIAAYTGLTSSDHDIEDTKSKTGSAAGDSGETQSVLLFTNDPSEVFGVPTTYISRIERVRGEQIDSVGGQEILQYRGVSLPLLALEQHIKAKPRLENLRALYIVVFKLSGREVGLIAPELVDIAEIPVDMDTTTFNDTGVVGSAIVNDKAVRLIDVYELAQVAHPEWFEQKEDVRVEAKKEAEGVILLAEDSSFFRQQMVNILETDGYKVVACEDGQIAWDTLQNETDTNFALVVTDIEMPNMDGLQLARAIKGDSRFAHIPIIAVTSLASEEDMQRGYEAGADDYHVKLDRDKLLATTARYLKAAKVKS